MFDRLLSRPSLSRLKPDALLSMFWDYLGSNPESLYQVMRLFSDLGTPYGFRHMHAWTGHTYRYAVSASATEGTPYPNADAIL